MLSRRVLTEKSHRLGVVLREVGCLGRAVRNKPNQLLREMAREDQPKFDL